MRSHTHVLREAKLDLASRFSLAPETVKSWEQRDSIPSPYWRLLADMGAATLDELATWATFKALCTGRRDKRRKPPTA